MFDVGIIPTLNILLNILYALINKGMELEGRVPRVTSKIIATFAKYIELSLVHDFT